MSNEKVIQILQDHGIKPSYQRIKIYEYLINEKNHPTADMIYRELAPGIPTLSKTTVYNTLKLFNSVDVVQKIMIEENEVRFDADMNKHGHFKCLGCGDIYDFPIKSTAIDYGMPEGFELKDEHIYCTGYCSECSSLQEKTS